MRSKETSIKASKLIAAPRNVGCDADVTDNEEFCKLHAKHSESLMMIHRILKLLLVFVFFGMSLVCEAGPSGGGGAVSRGMIFGYKFTTDPDFRSFILGLLAVMLVLGLVVFALQCLWKLIKFTFRGLWNLIKFIFLGLTVRLPIKLWKEKLFIPLLWRKKLFIPALWASIFKLPWLLQVKKFRRPDIWASNIPWGLLIINLILWACDAFLCAFSLCYDLRFLFLLVPSLILTYYLYVGAYWVRIAIVVLLVLACIVCGIYFGADGFWAMIWISLGLLVLLWLPKSNAWFRNQNGDVDGRKAPKDTEKMAETERQG